MQADYSIELGADDPALELPWRSDDGSLHYLNLRRAPDLLLNISEATDYPELSAFLSRMNSADFPLETAKCDVWFSAEISPEEEVFGATSKFASYIDVVLSDEGRRFSLEAHERLAKDVSHLLKRAPEMAAAAEFMVRHCHFHLDGIESDSRIGFCIAAYVTGYGYSREEARRRWGIGLKLVQNALVQAMKNWAIG